MPLGHQVQAVIFTKSVCMAGARLLISPLSAAGVAQLVEHFLAKEDVARSSRVTRSLPPQGERQAGGLPLVRICTQSLPKAALGSSKG